MASLRPSPSPRPLLGTLSALARIHHRFFVQWFQVGAAGRETSKGIALGFLVLLLVRPPLAGALQTDPSGGDQGGMAGGGLPAGMDGQGGLPRPDDHGLGSTRGPRTREEEEVLATFSWRVLWDVELEYYVDRRAHVHGEFSQDEEGYFLGRGERPQVPRPARKLSGEEVAEKVLPLCERLLETDRIPEVQAATLIAYARAARTQPVDERAQVVERIRPFLADPTRDVSEAATIALGITAHFSAVIILGDLVDADEAGRSIVGDREVPYRQRAYAAYGLALAAADIENEDVRRYAVRKLAGGVEADQGRWSDLEVACLIGLGMVGLGDDESSLEAEGQSPRGLTNLAQQLTFLLGVVVDPKAHRLARCHAATAIGRLVVTQPPPRREALSAELVPPIAALLKRGSRAPREVMQGAAMALGNLIDDDDDAASDAGRRALLRSFDLHDDTLTRALALWALGRAAGRPGLGREAGIGAAEARTFLLSTLTRGSTFMRTWAAMSLGMHAFDLGTQGRAVPSEVRSALRESLKRTDSPDELSAYAIAVGLLGDTQAVDRIKKRVLGARNDLLRGHTAVALGMLGDNSALPAARAAFFALVDRPAALERAALGRALLDDADLVHDLEGLLEKEGSLLGRVAMLLALGRFGDVRALETLLAWARPRGASSELRAVAVAALGMLAEPDAVPWPARIGWQINPYARTETLRGSGRGVLDAR